MKAVENKLNQTNGEILTVWFNAWRYEREEQFALIPLLKTLAYEMDKEPKYNEIREIFIKSIITIVKGLAAKYIFSDKYADEFHKNFTSEMKAFAEEDKDTIYFHGMKQIEDTMNKILKDYPKSRIVVFIDDLDRCSPKKALEVFESIKMFLGIDGLVYIIGLSHLTVAKLITAQYKESEIKGEQYIKKSIQIPLILPEWDNKDIRTLVDDPLKHNQINKAYQDIIQSHVELISEVVEKNP